MDGAAACPTRRPFESSPRRKWIVFRSNLRAQFAGGQRGGGGAGKAGEGRGGQRGGGRGGPGPGPKYSSVAAKFWLKDGALVKYSLRTQGTFSTQDGQEREFDSTTTTEFKKVGSTKVEVPEAAKKKLGA